MSAMRALHPFALAATLLLLLGACSGSGGGEAPTSTPPPGIATPTSTAADATPRPGPTATPRPDAESPDGPLLALTPSDGTEVVSQAVLVRGTATSGSRVLVNGVDTEVDASGDFTVAVIVGQGENVIVVEVTGADGTRVRRELKVIGS